jgi:hypothetical protein
LLEFSFKTIKKNLDKSSSFFSTVTASRNENLAYNSLKESEYENKLHFQNLQKNFDKSSSFFSTVNGSGNENFREKNKIIS